MRKNLILIIAIILIVFLLFFWFVNFTSIGDKYFSSLKIISYKKGNTTKFNQDTTLVNKKSLKDDVFKLDLKYENNYLYIKFKIDDEIYSKKIHNLRNKDNLYIIIELNDIDDFALSTIRISSDDLVRTPKKTVIDFGKLMREIQNPNLKSTEYNYRYYWKGNINFKKELFERISDFNIISNFLFSYPQ